MVGEGAALPVNSACVLIADEFRGSQGAAADALART
jgi:hypothetical protein